MLSSSGIVGLSKRSTVLLRVGQVLSSALAVGTSS